MWEPWRLGLVAESRNALATMRAVLRPNAVICDLLSSAYAPGERMLTRFGEAAALAQPTAACGRCPGCRSAGVEPAGPDAPAVPSRWPVAGEQHPVLQRVLKAAPTSEGLALIVADDPQAAAPYLAVHLARHGVAYFAGIDVPSEGSQSSLRYVDAATVGPADVPPVPALVVPPLGVRLSQQWLIPSERPLYADGVAVPVFLLVTPRTEVGARRRPASALPHLTCELASLMLDSRSQ